MLHSFTNTDYSQSVILLMRVYGLPGVLVVRDLPAKKKKRKKAKWLSGGDLQIAEKRREVEGKGEKEKYTHLNVEFQRTARRD